MASEAKALFFPVYEVAAKGREPSRFSETREITMDDFTDEQLAVAGKLLRTPYANEDQVRQDLSQLFYLLDVESIMSWRIAAARGPADLYLPRRRVVIETKSSGLANTPEEPQDGRDNDESPREQLERYVFGEMQREIELLPIDEHTDRNWTGVLTDGRVWHAWQHEHGFIPRMEDRGRCGREIFRARRPESPQMLLKLLTSVVSDTPIGKPWIPADPTSVFDDNRRKLHDIYEGLEGRVRVETETKHRLWLQMLRTANMEPENEARRQRLFVSHSFLVALARGVIASLTRTVQRPDASDLLSEGFIAWIIETSAGRAWADELMDDIHRYEWRLRPGDVLRPLYEAFVGQDDRKAFGEFYTPDWLAELLAREVLDDAWCERTITKVLTADRSREELRGVGVLDPACGSGTFLYHAARRLAGAELISGLPEPRQAEVVVRLVNGIDVHPVAAEMARATLLRALPGQPPDGVSSLRIYEGDSLLVGALEEHSLLQPREGDVRIAATRQENGAAVLPRSFVEGDTFAVDLRRLIAAAAAGAPLPPDLLAAVPDEDRTALEVCHDAFRRIMDREGNSVWFWYILNTAGPLRLRERKVDRILANPPWVSMAEVQALERKRALEHFAEEELDLWTGGRNAPHFDIAQLFVKRARQLYLATPERDPAAWVVKKAALQGGGWTRFREWHGDFLAQTLDLEAVQPFGGGDARRCCVLFEGRPTGLATGRMLEAVPDGRQRPEAQMSAEEALSLLNIRAAPPPLPRQLSDYVEGARNTPLFRQGATIVPKVLVVVSQSIQAERFGERTVTTARSDKRPWNGVTEMTGDIPERWLRDLITSSELLPFACNPVLPAAIVPTDEHGTLEAHPEENTFWRNRLERVWREHRGKGRATPTTLLGQIDYSGKLSAQLQLRGRERTLVLHPASGDIMRGARIVPGTAVVQHKIHYFNARNAAEAGFLVSLLNAPCLIPAFAQSRTSGRDFVNNPWRHIPIPRFDEESDLHCQLASLCEQAEALAEDWVMNAPGRYGQVAASKRIRERLSDERVFDRIDALVRDILPDHAEAA